MQIGDMLSGESEYQVISNSGQTHRVGGRIENLVRARSDLQDRRLERCYRTS